MAIESVSLLYSPGNHWRICTSSACRSFVWFAQPRSSAAKATAEKILTIRGAPLRAVGKAQGHEALQQLRVFDAGRASGFGKVFTPLYVGIGVGFQHEHRAVRPHTEIHAGIA